MRKQGILTRVVPFVLCEQRKLLAFSRILTIPRFMNFIDGNQWSIDIQVEVAAGMSGPPAQMNLNTYLARFLQLLAKIYYVQRFFKKNLHISRFLQTMSVFQESCRKRNSCKNLVRILQETSYLPEFSRLVLFVRSCRIL